MSKIFSDLSSDVVLSRNPSELLAMLSTLPVKQKGVAVGGAKDYCSPI